MLPRLTRQDDEEQWEVENWYGKPQHETGRQIERTDCTANPQHDISAGRSCITSDSDLDLGYALDETRLDFVREVGAAERRLSLATER